MPDKSEEEEGPLPLEFDQFSCALQAQVEHVLLAGEVFVDEMVK